jgi:hypothetical protein
MAGRAKAPSKKSKAKKQQEPVQEAHEEEEVQVCCLLNWMVNLLDFGRRRLRLCHEDAVAKQNLNVIRPPWQCKNKQELE